MKVILKKPFQLVREGRAHLVADITGRAIGVRLEPDVIYLEFDDGAMAITPEDFLAHTQSGDLEEVV